MDLIWGFDRVPDARQLIALSLGDPHALDRKIDRVDSKLA